MRDSFLFQPFLCDESDVIEIGFRKVHTIQKPETIALGFSNQLSDCPGYDVERSLRVRGQIRMEHEWNFIDDSFMPKV